jgi:thioredoxin 1
LAGYKATVLKEEDFEQFVGTSNMPVLVEFWADWCSPCHMIAPVVEEIAGEFAGKIQVARLDLEKNQKVGENLKVRSIPTLIFFKDGKEIERSIGFKSRDDLRRLIEKHL